jgi:spermidine synthase
MHSHLWVEEIFEEFYGMRFKVEKVLFSGRSSFQTVDVVQTKGHGRMLLNDGLIMVTERDEHVYHDMISHVPLFVHPNPKRVLVIGGGDGGTAREVLRHKNVQQVVMVEIDGMVVDACKEFIPQTAGALGDPRLELVIGDGVEYVKKAHQPFDVILVDSTDPIGPAQPLFGEEFYRDIFKLLSEDGIVVSQGESPFFHSDVQTSMIKLLGSVFPIVRSYNFSNLTYPGGLWSFSFASKKYHPLRDFKISRVEESGMEFDYYNAGIHTGAFALPNFMLKKLGPWFKDGSV